MKGLKCHAKEVGCFPENNEVPLKVRGWHKQNDQIKLLLENRSGCSIDLKRVRLQAGR